MIFILRCVLALLVSYLLGSVNSSIILSKLLDLQDPRDYGSTNPGATNVLRKGYFNVAILVFIIDFLKGSIAIWISHFIFGLPGSVLSLSVLCVVVGHIYPLFFKFKGGKGVATLIGALFALKLALALWVIAIWLLVAVIFQYASLASLASILSLLLIALLFKFNHQYFMALLLTALLITYRHRENIKRLLAGTESKIQLKFLNKS